MQFTTRINNIPCIVHVLGYSPAVPMHVYGSGMGDAHPPEPAEFEFEILDRKGYRAKWLDKYVDNAVADDLHQQYALIVEGDYYMKSKRFYDQY